MTSHTSYTVAGEHDEVMTVRLKPKQPQLSTFTSDDPLLGSAQYQVQTSFTKKMAPSIDNQLFSNQNEKDIDNYDDQELLKILVNINEDKVESIKEQKEYTYLQTHQNNVKSLKNENKAQSKDTLKVNGKCDGHLQDKEVTNDDEVLAYLETPSCDSGNLQVPHNLETSAETTIVLTSAEIFAQFEDTQVKPPQNLAQTQIVLTQSNAIQNIDKQVIPCSDVPQIFLNSVNATQLVQRQVIPVQNTVMIPAQSYHIKKHLSQAYSWPDSVATTSVAKTAATTATTSVAKTALYDTNPQQGSNTPCFNKLLNTRNIRKVCSPTQKRCHEEEVVEDDDDDDDKDFQIKKKGKMNDTKANQKIKKWEIKMEMKDPVEEQKRLNAKKARNHRMKEKREKEAMKDKIKYLEQRVKDLETNERVLKAENNLLKQFKIRL